jgi:trimethylamine--corrinoid protein Co-methyltransferase
MTKHVMAGLTKLEQLENVVHMGEIIAGGKQQLIDNPLLSFITCLVKSPMQFIDDTTQTLIEIAKKNLPLVVSCSPQAGTTAPLTELGITIQINAEILAGIVLSQLVNEGTPVLYGSVPVRTRLDTLNDSYGAPETSQYNIDSVQMARFYKIPCYSTSGVCDNKTPGMQSTVERMFSNILVTISGPQFLHCAYGLLDNNGTFCPLQAVLDDAHFQMLEFFLRPPKFGRDDFENNLAQIREVVSSKKKLYIGYIRSLMRSGQVSMPYPFETDGDEDKVMEKARQRMEQLLQQPVNHIDQTIAKKVFDEIPGLLPELNNYK